MVIYSSKTTSQFHESDYGQVPADAIEISAELHQYLLGGQTTQQMINFSTEPPSLMDRPPVSVEHLTEAERAWRDAQLTATDGVVTRHRDELEEGIATTLTAERYRALQTYRQQLRDWPQGGGFPQMDLRPTAPSWLLEQEQ
ncbi:phage tail assembly chaperone [Pseudomonas sp. MAG733B]|uniref:phage tail assembly chaperone n=1 Tax=Pseudomonas sp. MAG733B TaxID=3122079 RepID=UPI0030D33195